MENQSNSKPLKVVKKSGLSERKKIQFRSALKASHTLRYSGKFQPEEIKTLIEKQLEFIDENMQRLATSKIAKTTVLQAERKALFILFYSANGGNVGNSLKQVGIDRRTYQYWRDEKGLFLKELEFSIADCTDNMGSSIYKMGLEGNFQAAKYYVENKAPDEWKDRRNEEPIKSEIEVTLPGLQALLEKAGPGIFQNPDKVREAYLSHLSSPEEDMLNTIDAGLKKGLGS